MSYPIVREHTREHVNGAGMSEVKGAHSQCGESYGIFEFENSCMHEKYATVIILCKGEGYEYWFIKIVVEHNRDTTVL